MRVADASCEVVFGLLGRFYDRDMTPHDREVFEQHLLFCPHCMVENAKMRVALAALPAAATAVPDDQLLDRLTLLAGS